MGRNDDVPAGSASLVLTAGVRLLHPETQLFEAMLEGWRNQMLARNLAPATIRNEIRLVRAFAAYADAYPWRWRGRWPTSGSLTCARFAMSRSPRCAAIRSRSAVSVGSSPTPGTGGRPSVSDVSAPTRCR